MVKDTKLYDLLGVPSSATDKEIEKAFKKMALKWHPDKWVNDTAENKQIADAKFKEIEEAKSILVDPMKRKIYDAHGYEATKGNGGMGGMGGMSAEDFHDMMGGFMGGMGGFMGGGFGQRGRKIEAMIPDVEVNINVSMKDIYIGSSIEFELSRYNLKKDKNPTKQDIVCSKCNGNGMTIKTVQMGPGMITQQQVKCDKCMGKGIALTDTFFEKKTQKFTKTLPKGIYSKIPIITENQGNEIPEAFKNVHNGQTRTKLIINVIENSEYFVNNHKYFRFDNMPHNLHTKIKIQQHEAICGTHKKIPFIDDSELCIKIPQGIAFKNDRTIVVVGKGMPYFNQKTYGDLIIEIEIVQSTLNESQLNSIWSVYSTVDRETYNKMTIESSKNGIVNGLTSEQYKSSDAYNKNNHRHSNRRMNDDDDDDHFGGNPFNGNQGASCTQQ
jgi:DnaJ-class molecular chaperone